MAVPPPPGPGKNLTNRKESPLSFYLLSWCISHETLMCQEKQKTRCSHVTQQNNGLLNYTIILSRDTCSFKGFAFYKIKNWLVGRKNYHIANEVIHTFQEGDIKTALYKYITCISCRPKLHSGLNVLTYGRLILNLLCTWYPSPNSWIIRAKGQRKS